MPLEVGLGQFGQGKSLPQRGHQVFEVDAACLDRALLATAAPRREGPIAQAAQLQGLGNRLGNIPAHDRRLAVELDEVDDPDSGRQVEESLLEAEQEVFHLRGLGLGLLT